MNKIKSITFIALALMFWLPLLISGCSGEDEELGIGPVKHIELGAIDNQLVEKGKQIFEVKCISCHKYDSRLVGPPLKDVTKRRKPEWLMNMMLNPVQMTQENPAARELFTVYLVQMTFQDVSYDDARALLDYLRAVDENLKPPF